MAIIPQAFLLNGREIDAASDLDRLRLVLEAIPDEPLMRILERERGNGRDEYPIRPAWNSILAGGVFQHPPPSFFPQKTPPLRGLPPKRAAPQRRAAPVVRFRPACRRGSRADRLCLQQFSGVPDGAR